MILSEKVNQFSKRTSNNKSSFHLFYKSWLCPPLWALLVNKPEGNKRSDHWIMMQMFFICFYKGKSSRSTLCWSSSLNGSWRPYRLKARVPQTDGCQINPPDHRELSCRHPCHANALCKAFWQSIHPHISNYVTNPI